MEIISFVWAKILRLNIWDYFLYLKLDLKLFLLNIKYFKENNRFNTTYNFKLFYVRFNYVLLKFFMFILCTFEVFLHYFIK